MDMWTKTELRTIFALAGWELDRWEVEELRMRLNLMKIGDDMKKKRARS